MRSCAIVLLLVSSTASAEIDVDAEVRRAVEEARTQAARTRRGLAGQFDFTLDGEFPGRPEGAPLTKAQRELLEAAAGPVQEAQRELFGGALQALGYAVLPRDGFREMLEANGVSDDRLARAGSAKDLAEQARELKLEVFLWGSVLWLGEAHGFEALIGANRSSDLAVLTNHLVQAPDGPGLRRELEKAAPKLIESLSLKLVPELRKAADDARARAEAERKRELEEELRRKQAERYALPEDNPLVDLGGHVILRGGYGGAVGILGGGLELALGPVAIGVGYGTHLTASATIYPLGSPRDGGGPYLSGHWATASAGPDRTETGYGGTLGWDWRPVKWISVKLGLGAARTNLAQFAATPQVLVFDVAGGLVF